MRGIVIVILAGALCADACFAHPATLATATATVDACGRVTLRARFDLLAFALNETPQQVEDDAMNELLGAPPEEMQAALDGARDRFLNEFTAFEDVRVEFPTAADVERAGRRLPVMGDVTLTGRLADGASSVAFRFPDVLGRVVLTVERSGAEPYAEPLEAGATSTAFALAGSASDPGAADAALKYLRLGFTHILPHGPDHVLFVLGLFLLSARLRPLLWQVTAFTVAHSITLALALYGVVRLPPIVVEPLIALSIAIIAFENLFTTDLKPWRPLVVFGFGLVHGLGFAGVLSEVGLPRGQYALALLTFNVGVELGQLAVIGLALAAVGWLRRYNWYRPAVAVPASMAIALVAVLWTVERIWA